MESGDRPDMNVMVRLKVEPGHMTELDEFNHVTVTFEFRGKVSAKLIDRGR